MKKQLLNRLLYGVITFLSLFTAVFYWPGVVPMAAFILLLCGFGVLVQASFGWTFDSAAPQAAIGKGMLGLFMAILGWLELSGMDEPTLRIALIIAMLGAIAVLIRAEHREA